MKAFLLLTLSLLLFASSEDTNSNITKKILALEKEMQHIHEDLDERMPIIEENEKRSILDKINFSPELLLRLDKFNYNNKNIVGENTTFTNSSSPYFGEQKRDSFTKNFDPSLSIRLKLNMDAIVGDAKFHGRLLYANSTQANQRVCILSKNIKSGSITSSAFDLDRAYIDYSPNKDSEYPFTFTFGLLPTTDGTPMQYKQDKKRGSLFPALVFDMNTYGLIGTQKFHTDTFLRMIVAKAYTLRTNFYPYQCNRESIYNATVTGLYLDTKYDFLGDALLSFGFNAIWGFKAQPYLGPEMDFAPPSDLGNMFTLGLGTDIKNILETPTTLFFHTALSNPHPNGKQDDYQITSTNPNGFTEATYATGTMLQKNGYSLFFGLKHHYTQSLNIGLEYNYGSKYWFSATQGAEDMFNKLATRGSVYELYANWIYYKSFNARFSYLNIQEEYTGSGWHFGEPASKDAIQNIFSITLETRF